MRTLLASLLLIPLMTSPAAELGDLVPVANATHSATSTGAWSDPGTWSGSQVPDAGAMVHIPSGTSVTYDIDQAQAQRLQWLRVDGTLQISDSTNTYLLVDTLAVMANGHFIAGTENDPIPAGVQAKIVFAVGEMQQLSGTVLSDDSAGNAAKLFDGDSSTDINGGGKWYGLDFGQPETLTAFRIDFEKGPYTSSDYDHPCIVEGANQADFSDATELLRFDDWAPNGPTRLAITDPGSYRYARVRIQQSYKRLSEIQFWTGDNSPIDTVNDPGVLGRGLIAMGQVDIHGADKTDWLALPGAPLQGDTVLTLNQEPLGWHAGDVLVLTGVNEGSGSAINNELFQNEVLRLESITQSGSDWDIAFTNLDTGGSSLRFDHEPRPAGKGLSVYLANLSRNISFQTEGWQAGGVPSQQRGHVMLMHNDDFDVRHAAFHGLGRTDKIFKVTDPLATDADNFIISTDNPRGRYAFHVHRANNQDRSLTPPEVVGCAVWDSPGWAFANHDSYVHFSDCVSFDVLGAHYMTELGNELGAFKRCLAVKSTGGANGDEESRFSIFDHGHHGQGFWIQGGGGIILEDCVATACADNAYYIWGDNGIDGDRHPLVEQYTSESFADSYYEDAYGRAPFPDEVPMLSFKRNIGFNSKIGFSANYLMWQKLDENDDMRVPDYSVLEDSDFWGIYGVAGRSLSGVKGGAGLFIYYSGNFHLKNCRVYGHTTSLEDPTSQGEKAATGIHANWAAMNLILENCTIEGWDVGLKVFSTQKFSGVYRKGINEIHGGSFENRVNLVPSQSVAQPDMGETFTENPPFGYLEIHDEPDFRVPASENNAAPTADFAHAAAGGLAVRFDGTLSSDPDLTQADPAIAAYGWDFDNNGTIDAFGSEVVHTFASSGTKTVTLTVWDDMGVTAQKSATVAVAQSDYPNLLVDGSFDTAEEIDGVYGSIRTETGSIEEAWYTRYDTSNISKDSVNEWLEITGNEVFGQVQLNQRVHRGAQELSLSIDNIEGDGTTNSLTVAVYGINVTGITNSKGLSTDTVWEGKANAFSVYGSGPSQLGAYPFESAVLLPETQILAGDTGGISTVALPTMDFGDGYDFISVVFRASGIDASDGDQLILDDIVLEGGLQSLAVQAQEVRPQTVRVQWQAIAETDWYQVVRRDVTSVNQVAVILVDADRRGIDDPAVTGSLDDQRYDVQALAAGPLLVQEQLDVIPVGNGLQATRQSESEILVEWDALAADWLFLDRKRTDAENQVMVIYLPATATSYTDTNVQAMVEYLYGIFGGLDAPADINL